MKKLYPPIGYKFESDVNADSEEEVLDVIKGLSDELYERAKKHTHKERLQMLKENGFEVKN